MKAGPVVMSPHVRMWVGAGGGGTAPPGMPAPAVAYSLRKLLATANPLKAARIRRASDNAEQDIGFVGNDFDTAAATTFCAATTCFLRAMYDQTLTGRDVAQAIVANQPELVFGCTPAGQPCLRMTVSGSQNLASINFTPSSTVMSLNGVSRRSGATGACYVVTGTFNNRIQFANGLTGYQLLANLSAVAAAASAAENAWHSTTGIINGAASSLVADAATTTGTGTPSVSAGPNVIAQGVAGTTCNWVEALYWDATALTAQQAADLNSNQKAYWGF